MYPYRFGPYVLLQPLGEGGMGKVALALVADERKEQLCVVKRLHARYLKDGEHRKRFDDEAAISRRLSHPNLVDTLAAGEVNGEPFIAQGFVDGRDLSEFIGRSRSQKIQVPTVLWLHIVREVAQGLAYAHDFEGLELVHRDINPPNIRISFSGEVKLLDFGLAKWKDKSSQTVEGSLLGKTAYIAPEQLKNERPDRRSDIFVLGIVLWELLTGQPFGTILKDGRPTYADDERAALARLFSPIVVPPSRFATTVGADLDKVVLKALAEVPSDRYQTAGEFAAALGKFVPHDFAATEKLAGLMRFGFASEVETKHRRAMIEAARRLSPPAIDVGPEQGAEGMITHSSFGHRRQGKVFLLLGCLACLVTGGGLLIARRHAPGEQQPLVQPAEPPPRSLERPPVVAPRAVEQAAQPAPAPTTEPEPPSRIRRAVAPPTKAERSRELSPRETPPASRGDLSYQAKEAFSAGDLDRAARLANEAIALGADADAWVVIGNVDFKRRAYAEASKAYAQALKLRPDNSAIAKRRQMALKLAAEANTTP